MFRHSLRRLLSTERNPVRLSVLPSGLRTASSRGPSHGHHACLTVSVASGTRHEGPSSSGAAHFMEHMFFKGTEHRSQRAFEKEVEDMGGNVQAYTSREVTQFSIQVPKGNVERGFDVLSDVLMRPKIDADAVMREVSVIDQEWDYVMKTYPEESLHDHMHAAAFNKESGLGFNILGDGKAYRRVTREDLVNYRDANYIAPKMVVSVAGIEDHAEAVDLTSKYFGAVPESSPAGVVKHTPGPVQWEGGDVRVHDDDMSSVSAAIAFQGPGCAHPDILPLIVLQGLFSQWTACSPGASLTSNKFGQATQNDGVEGPIMAESVGFFLVPYSDVTLVGFNFKSAPGPGVEELTYHLETELVKTAFLVSDADLARAKASVLKAIAASSASARGASEEIGKHLLYYGRHLPYEEIEARIAAVTAADIHDVVGKYIYDRCPTSVAIGPELDYYPEYNRLRSWSYFLMESAGPGLGGATTAGPTSDPTTEVLANARE